MNALDEELKEKGNTIEKYNVEIRRRNDEIETKTKEVDRLNRAYDKLTYNMEDANNGPLEATIANLQREITQKGVEGKELQRRWVGFQVELVGLVNENNVLDEAVQRLKSEHTVMMQKRSRLNGQYDQHTKEMAALDKSVAHMHTDMQRLNALISKNTELQQLLANDNFVLEMNVVNELKELEAEAIKVEQRIDQVVDEKKQVLAEIVEAERQVMLWERKITLERELQEALDPNIGGDIVEAMKKEIHRMELRHSELLRHQEKLIQEMEKAITRRDTINLKGRVMASKKVPDMTESNLKKACLELTKSIRETDVETKRSEERIQGLDSEREQLGQALDDVSLKCRDLQDAEQELQMDLANLGNEKMQSLFITSKTQKSAKRLEDLQGGRYQLSHQGDRDLIINDLDRSEAKRQTIMDVVQKLIESEPRLEGPLMKTQLLLSV
jgi:chromosome segregation ATPase